MSSLLESPIPLLVTTTSLLAAAVTVFLLLPRFRSLSLPSPPSGQKLCLPHLDSNLSDEFTYTSSPTLPSDTARIKSLWLYPLKSAKGIEVPSALVGPTGFKYDREFILAEWKSPGTKGTPEQWVMLTLRLNPKMALITTSIYTDETSPSGGTLVLTFPTKGSTATITLPLNPIHSSSLPTVYAKVHFSNPLTLDLSPLIPAVALRQLGELIDAKGKVTILRSLPGERRQTHAVPTVEEVGYGNPGELVFQDKYPLNLQNLASVRDLEEKVKAGGNSEEMERVSVRRFRPNVVVEGPGAWDEDNWKRLEIGGGEGSGMQWLVSCRTIRCKLPNVDPDTGVRARNEPDSTMRGYRAIDEGTPGGACMGMQMLLGRGEGGVVRTGDVVRVVERGRHVSK